MTKVRAVLRRRWPILVVAAALGVVAGVASTLGATERQPVYVAEQVVVASSGRSESVNVPQDALKVSRGEVPTAAAELLGEPSRAADLAEQVEVVTDDGSNSMTLRFEDADPEFASNVVQAFAEAFLQVVNEELRSGERRQLEQLNARVEDATAALAAFDEANASVIRPDVPVQQSPALDALLAERTRLADALTSAEQQLSDFLIQTARQEPYTTLGPESPVLANEELLTVPSSAPFRGGLLGLAGLLLGLGLVVAIERLNPRIDTREELAALVKVPIIAEIGRIADDKLPRDQHGRPSLEGVWSEHYRRVRSAIQFMQKSAELNEAPGAAESASAAAHAGAVIARSVSGQVPRVFMFVSALPGEGKSTSTLLTAMALAETGDETVIVNADFRRPSLEEYLRARQSPSLEDLAVLSPDRPTVDEVVQHTGFDHLWLVAAGSPTREVEGRLQATRELAVEAARRGGTVLIDSSPMQVANDPIDLLPIVDRVVVVVRAGRSTTASLEETLSLLDMHHAAVLGVVLIGTASTQEAYGYYGAYLDQPSMSIRRRRRREVATGVPEEGKAPRRPDAWSPRPPSPAVNGHPVQAATPAGWDSGTPSQVPPVGAYARHQDRFSVGPNAESVGGHDNEGAYDRPVETGAPATAPPPLPPQYQSDRPRDNPFAPRPRS